MESTKIFIAYSRKDEAYLKDLRTYLRPIERNHSIETWSDENILAGKPWEKEIKDNLHAADIILLLVSANSLASDYFYEKEMADALVRHDKGEAVVIPVILSHCAWKITELKELQALPKDGVPISKWQDKSEAYTNIVLKLQENIEEVLEKKAEEEAKKRQQEEDKLQSQEGTTKEEKDKTILKQNLNIRYAAMGIGFFLCLLFWGFLQIRSLNLKSISSIENQDTTAINRQANKEIDTSKEQTPPLKGVRGMPDTTRHKNQLKKTKAELDKIEKNFKYWLNSANTKYNQKDWEAAKEDYQEAAKYENTKYVKDQIAAIDWKLKEEQKIKLHPEIQKLVDDMVGVKGDSFQMGSENGRDNEKPVHKVALSDFSIGKYEVTQAQWEAVMGTNPSEVTENCSKCPIETVSWNDTQEFIKKLNELTRKKFRLPTEAEWEFAARGGIKSQGYEYAGSNNRDEAAWHYSNSDKKTHPVGELVPNELGLYDMSGNVWEWCGDDWHSTYVDAPVDGSAWIDEQSGRDRLVRGGSWNVNDNYCRVAIRLSNLADDRASGFGLRLALPQF